MHEVKLNVPVDRSIGVSLKDIKRYLKLAQLTQKSIKGEIDNCHAEVDYVQIVAPWFAVKCYYRTYYLESVLIHLASGTHDVFRNNGHSYVRKTIRNYCKIGYIHTKKKYAEVVEPLHVALNHKIISGQNLTQDYYLTEECVRSVRHKLADYSLQHWKKNSIYKRFQSSAAKAELSGFQSKSEVCLFDFFYQMRVKANYRDTDFLDFDKILSEDGLEYIELLKGATDKYCSALQTCIDEMLRDRSISL